MPRNRYSRDTNKSKWKETTKFMVEMFVSTDNISLSINGCFINIFAYILHEVIHQRKKPDDSQLP